MNEQLVDTIFSKRIGNSNFYNFIKSFNSAISFNQRKSLKIFLPFEIELSNFFALFTDLFFLARDSSPNSYDSRMHVQ